MNPAEPSGLVPCPECGAGNDPRWAGCWMCGRPLPDAAAGPGPAEKPGLRDVLDAEGPPAGAKGQERPAAFEQVRLRLELAGSYGELLAFLNRLERNPALIRVDELTLTADAKTEGLGLRVDLSTFRYRA